MHKYGYYPDYFRMSANVVRVETLLPKKDVQVMDAIVESGFYATRTDLLRSALRQLIRTDFRQRRMKEAFALIETRVNETGADPLELIKEFDNSKTGRKAQEWMKRAQTRSARR